MRAFRPSHLAPESEESKDGLGITRARPVMSDTGRYLRCRQVPVRSACTLQQGGGIAGNPAARPPPSVA